MKKRILAVLLVSVSLLILAYVNPDYQSPIANVVKECAPAVVKIDAVKYTSSPFFDPFMEDFFKRWFGDVPWGQQREATSLGSGFIFDKEGYILTNQHVVDGSEKITVTTLDGKVYNADYIGGDDELDIAILKINPDEDLPILELGDSDSLEIGEWTIAIGNPLGFQHTVTIGVLSATGRKIPKPDGSGYYTNLLQTDAAINPGNSGGPLLNIHGQVIGINTAIINPQEAVNLGFAIPINTAKRFIDSLIKTGKAQKAQLGVVVMTVTEELAKALGLKVNYGAIVTQVLEDSPAERAGIIENDVIVKFNDINITTKEELVSLIHSHTPGDTVNLTVERSGKQINISVTLGEAQEESAVATEAKEFLGIVVDEMTNYDRESYSIPESVEGVVIRQIKNASFSQLQAGDVITAVAVNGKRYYVETLQDWNTVTEKIKQGDFVALFIYRRGSKLIFSFTYR